MKRLRTRRSRSVLAAVVVVAVAAGAVAATLALRENDGWQHPNAHALFKGDPDRQSKDTPTSALATPTSYEAQQIAALAYPASALKASLLNNERAFYNSTVKGRSAAQTGGWTEIGPTTATQPAVLNFFDFQSSDFQVSGRVTAMAVAPDCNLTSCKLWVAAAGGGVWRNDNALDPGSPWKFLSGSFGTNAIGTLTYDAPSHTLYAGTGEPNASGDSESGVGIYASKNNGNSWTFLPGSSVMNARSISSIVVDPNHPGTLYVGDARGVRGVTGVSGGAVSLAPDAAPWGLYKSTDGGQTFNLVWNGNGSIRGVNHVEMDSHGTIYAAAFQQGIWRSADGGSTWEQVFATKDPTNNAARTEFALNTTPDGHTRIYVGDGGRELDTAFPPHSNTGVYRGDAIDTKSSADLVTGGTDGGYVVLTDPSRGRADPTYDYCSGQCWYDNYVVSPAGHPDMVYIGGSFDYNLYGFGLNDGRAVLLSQDAGATWTDQMRDKNGVGCQPGTDCTGIHPDQHALVVDPANPLLFFEGSDGGVIRSSGQLTDASSTCSGGFGPYTTTCEELLSAIPTQLTTINRGLSALQFQNVAFDPNSPGTLMGGTQDNGTWLGPQNSHSWNQTIYGDGGVAAFDASDSTYKLNEFYAQYTDGNFANGDPTKWVVLSGPFFTSHEASSFYKPQIGDPNVGGTFFVGLQDVFRTQDYGGDRSFLEANCPEFTTPGSQANCGDFAPLGDATGVGLPGNAGDLTSTNYGSDRTGGYIVSLARASSDNSTLWAATATGRVFVSQNADASDPAAVSFTRIDSTSSASPGRFVSGIAIDPSNPDRAWISYTGYNANTPSQPGHVFQVDFDPGSGTATWTPVDAGADPLGDLPVTGIARDDSTGTLYAATDFGVLADEQGSWVPAAPGMPQVEVAWITIDPSTHTLYAATHGRGIWSLPLSGKK